MNMAYLIHFASPGTLQDIKQVSMNYTQLVAAIDGTSVEEDFPDEIGVIETKGVNKVDKIVNLHGEKEFIPNGDMTLIQELIQQKQLVEKINNLKDTYVQVKIENIVKADD